MELSAKMEKEGNKIRAASMLDGNEIMCVLVDTPEEAKKWIENIFKNSEI
jgi:hypothetical protein